MLNKPRKHKITFFEKEHQYTVEGHPIEFTSVTTFINDNFYADSEEFSLSHSMYLGLTRRIKKIIYEHSYARATAKQESPDKKKQRLDAEEEFLSLPANIRHVPKLALQNKDCCHRCSAPFIEETLLVEYLYKDDREEPPLPPQERKDSIPIKSCPSCYNRYPKRIFENEILKEDIAGLWLISQRQGTFLHAFIEDLLKGVYKDEDEIHMAIYVTRGATSFMRFYQAAMPEMQIIQSEFRVASVKYGIAGTIDALAYINGVLTAVDWKGVKQITEKRPYYKLKYPFDFFDSNKLAGYSTQIATYRVCYQEEFPDEEIKRGIIVCMDPLVEDSYDVYELIGFPIFSDWIHQCIHAIRNKQPLPAFTRQKEVYWVHLNGLRKGKRLFAREEEWDI